MPLGKARLIPNPYHVFCEIYGCNHPAKYMVTHEQGLLGTGHFMLCEDCAKSIILNLPEELKNLVSGPPKTLAQTLQELMNSTELYFALTSDSIDKKLLQAIVDFDMLLREIMGHHGLLNAEVEGMETVKVDRKASAQDEASSEERSDVEEAPEAEEEPETYVCTKCGRTFTSKIGLISHMRSCRGLAHDA